MTLQRQCEFGLEGLLGDQASLLHQPRLVEDYLIAHGPVERLSAFAELPILRTALDAINAWDGMERTARAWSPAGGPAYELYPAKSQLRTLYDAGATIVLESIERFVPALRPLCRQLERELQVEPGCVNVEIFCARRGGHGRPHFDPSFTFNCQIIGDKTWHLQRDARVQHPSFGMFLGRTPTVEPVCHDSRSLPSGLTEPDIVVAKPGTVIFLPPGILHETLAEGETYAIAFAIEHVDCIAARILQEARRHMFAEVELRAGRFGAQFETINTEIDRAARVLRKLADQLEAHGLPARPRFVLRAGLSVTVIDATRVEISSSQVKKTLTLDPVGAALLAFAADRRPAFSFSDLIDAVPSGDAERLEQCLHQFANAGILEVIQR